MRQQLVCAAAVVVVSACLALALLAGQATAAAAAVEQRVPAYRDHDASLAEVEAIVASAAAEQPVNVGTLVVRAIRKLKVAAKDSKLWSLAKTRVLQSAQLAAKEEGQVLHAQQRKASASSQQKVSERRRHRRGRKRSRRSRRRRRGTRRQRGRRRRSGRRKRSTRRRRHRGQRRANRRRSRRSHKRSGKAKTIAVPSRKTQPIPENTRGQNKAKGQATNKGGTQKVTLVNKLDKAGSVVKSKWTANIKGLVNAILDDPDSVDL